jgi:hypothetical protein
MRTVRRFFAAGLATLALAVTAYAPVPALADTADTSGTVVATTTPPTAAQPSRRAILKYRAIARVRLAAFNSDAAVLRHRVNRLSWIASLVSKAGGDVSGVRAELKSARDCLAQSRQQAIVAAAHMRLVPYSADRKSALATANAEFKSARGTLKTARSWKKKAAHDLWALVKQLRMTAKFPAKNFG